VFETSNSEDLLTNGHDCVEANMHVDRAGDITVESASVTSVHEAVGMIVEGALVKTVDAAAVLKVKPAARAVKITKPTNVQRQRKQKSIALDLSIVKKEKN
jgi:hypothetical protein